MYNQLNMKFKHLGFHSKGIFTLKIFKVEKEQILLIFFSQAVKYPHSLLYIFGIFIDVLRTIKNILFIKVKNNDEIHMHVSKSFQVENSRNQVE